MILINENHKPPAGPQKSRGKKTYGQNQDITECLFSL